MPPAIQILLASLALSAAVFDLRERKVPNWLALAGFLAGLSANVALSALPGLALALAGTTVALLIYVPLYALRVTGGGDVKLMAALGAIAGPGHWTRLFLCTALMGAVLAVVLLTAQGRTSRILTSLEEIAASVSRGRSPHEDHPQLDVRNPEALRMPHALTIALGTLGYLIAYATGVLS